jgi:hypothetical protein
MDRSFARQYAPSRPLRRSRRDEQYITFHPTQHLIGNTANQYALEAREAAASDDYQIRPFVLRDLFDGMGRRSLWRGHRDSYAAQTGTFELRFDKARSESAT